MVFHDEQAPKPSCELGCTVNRDEVRTLSWGATLLLAMCVSFNPWLCYYYLIAEIFILFYFVWVRIKLFLFRIFLRAGLFILDKIGKLSLIFFFFNFTIGNFCYWVFFFFFFFGLVYFVLNFRSINFLQPLKWGKCYSYKLVYKLLMW